VDNELEVIHHQMEGTRASLSDKLDTLENHVLGTVHEATSAVTHTVEDVKSVVGTVSDSIQETVQSVKEAFDLREHVRRHPWMSLSGAVAAGYIGGCMLAPARPALEESRTREEPRVVPPAPQPPSPPQAERSSSEESSLLAPLQTLKTLAIGALMNLVRDVVATSLPENLKPDVLNLVDDVTTRLGGKPLRRSEEQRAEEKQPSPAAGQAPSLAEGGEHNGHRNEPEMARQMGTTQGESQEPVGKPDRRRSGPRRG